MISFRIPHIGPGPIHGFPSNESDFTDWSTLRIAASGVSNNWLITLPLDVSEGYHIFEGNDEPTDWDDAVAFINLAEIIKMDAVLKALQSGKIITESPVTPTGELKPLIIGDDYFEPRAPVWWIDPPDADISQSEFWLGIGGREIQGSIVADTFKGQPKWKLIGAMDRGYTGQFKPGRYGLSLELRKPLTSASDKHVTVFRGVVEMLEKFT